MLRVMMLTKNDCQVNEDVNRDKAGEADGMNLEVDFTDEVICQNERSVIFSEELMGKKG